MWEVTAMKHKLLTAAAALPIAFCLSWSAIHVMVTGLNLPVDAPGRLCIIWLLCALAGCVLFSFKHGGLPTMFGCCAAAVWLWHVGGISRPIRALITRLSTLWNNAYHWGILEFPGVDWQTTSLDLLFATLGGAIALVAAAALIRGRGGMMVVLLSLPPLVATLVVTDTAPDALPLLGMAIAITLILLTGSVARQSPLQGAKLTALAAVPTALVLGGLFLLSPKDSYVNHADEQLNAIVAWWQDTVVSPFQGGSNLGQDLTPTVTASASTRLGSLGPRRVTPYKVMEVTASFDGTLYLRGQDYDQYDGMSWISTTDRTEVLTKSPYAAHRGTVTVKTLRPVDFIYLPTYPNRDYDLTEGRVDNTEGETEFFWSVASVSGLPDRFTSFYDDYPDLTPYLELPQSTLDWAKPLVEQIQQKWVEQGLSENQYSYSIDENGHIISADDSTGSITTGTFEPSTSYLFSDADTVQFIINYVGNSARYSLNPKRMDHTYDDFAQWFLEESDKGYCVHFATAATVLLRAAGIPARYVTGYMVNCAADQTIVVESDRAHAWVEYYDEDLQAWIVAEPTPPDLGDDEPETESITAPPPVTQPLTEPEDQDETTAPTRPTDDRKNPQTDGSEKEFRLWNVLRWVLLVILLWLIIALQRLVRIALRRRAMAGGPNNRALGLWQDVEGLCNLLDQEPPEELLELALKAKYSQHRLTREELRQFALWLKATRRELNNRPLLQRLWCRYVLALW